MDMIELGQALRHRRKMMALTQHQLAATNGMSRATISNLENGKLPELGLRKVIALCSTLGLELCLREEAPRPTLRDLIAEQGK
jgi:HTH-type transcriptional regulator / antitoxin HipB